MKWTHRYKYKLELPYPYPRVGTIVTGEVQTEREYSDKEIEILAKEMAHGIFDHVKLTECHLIECR